MIGGVNFQPGSQEEELRKRGAGTGVSGRTGSEGVQEAIKVLSLRLPKVIGAQALAPSALLNAPGGMGRPGVDSIVEQVLAKFFPGGSGAGAQAPMAPQPMAPTSPGSPQMMQSLWRAPRVSPGETGPRPTVYPEPPSQSPAEQIGAIKQPTSDAPPALPPAPPPAPDLRQHFDWLPSAPYDRYEL